MDLLVGYHSSSEGDGDAPPPPLPDDPPPKPLAKAADRRYLNAAPHPSLMASHSSYLPAPPGASALTVRRLGAGSSPSVLPRGKGGKLTLMNNPLMSVLMKPSQGPTGPDPAGPKPQSRGVVGEATADVAFDDTAFHRERTRFQRTGKAIGPGHEGSEVERTSWGHCKARYGESGPRGASEDDRPTRKRSRVSREEREARGRELVEGSDDEATYGVWGPPGTEERALRAEELSDVAKGVELAPEQVAEREHLAERNRRKGERDTEANEAQRFDRMVERKMSHLLPPRVEGEEPKAVEPKTIFHGKEEFDYRGRSWTAPPSGSGSAEWGDIGHHKCFVPKKCVARLTGHNNGVNRIRLSPNTGHLLLSAGLEGKCKVWSVPNKCVMRTYIGHSAAVRDVTFNNDGSRFLSASFDRFVRLWNTETGEVVGTYTNRRVPYVVKFYPHDDNTFVVGCSDNKIVAYDSSTGEITQEYNHHLAPVNTITFVEDHGTKMITSSDDKKILVWEWDIGVPIKYISDPTMHSIPAVALHPTGQYWVGQSLDNAIVVYQAADRFALQRKKRFTGHNVAGYACDLCLSPDGQFVTAGDGEGRLHFWDWRRHRSLQKYRAHDNGPAAGVVWHPVEPSTVFTCGWDGVIKIWQ